MNDEIVGAVQEERFTKRKNQVAFPAKSIAHLVNTHLDGKFNRIQRVALAGAVVDPVGLAIARYSDFEVQDHIDENKNYWRGVFYDGKPHDGSYWKQMFRRGVRLNSDHNVDVVRLMSLPLTDAIRQMSDVERQDAMHRSFCWAGPFDTLDHHGCHAYYAFYGQKIPRGYWEDTLILTADALGDNRDWSAWTAEADGCLTRIQDGTGNHVARIYRFTTLILGMKPNEHEYKVMGLSAYSKSRRHIQDVEKIFFQALDFRDGKFVQERPLKDSYFDLRDRLEGHRFDNVAAALQNWASAVTRSWIRHWLARTDRRRLCFAGGLSMNIKMNGDIAAMPELDGLNVPASGGDESNAIGACFFSRAADGSNIQPLSHVFLGVGLNECADGRWEAGISQAGAHLQDYAVREDFGSKELAALLASGHVVARCVGPMEFGARALGNRSILADPSKPENVKLINDAIKNRDFWMPFTPSILAERAGDYLKIPKGIVSPYMTIGYESTEEGRRDIVAALHPGDFSARPQFVQRDVNFDYWSIIREFEKLTGIGALLNTSLNLHGDPMNSTIADAARTLALSSLEFLAIPGDKLLYKKTAGTSLAAVLDSSE